MAIRLDGEPEKPPAPNHGNHVLQKRAAAKARMFAMQQLARRHPEEMRELYLIYAVDQGVTPHGYDPSQGFGLET